MNRLEREVLQELEDEYEYPEDRAIAIVALCREAFETEIRDKEEALKEEEQRRVDYEYSRAMKSMSFPNVVNYSYPQPTLSTSNILSVGDIVEATAKLKKVQAGHYHSQFRDISKEASDVIANNMANSINELLGTKTHDP